MPDPIATIAPPESERDDVVAWLNRHMRTLGASHNMDPRALFEGYVVPYVDVVVQPMREELNANTDEIASLSGAVDTTEELLKRWMALAVAGGDILGQITDGITAGTIIVDTVKHPALSAAMATFKSEYLTLAADTEASEAADEGDDTDLVEKPDGHDGVEYKDAT